MNISDYLDQESSEINYALNHGFRKGDINAIGRAVVEEIRARRELVKTLNIRLRESERRLKEIEKTIASIAGDS